MKNKFIVFFIMFIIMLCSYKQNDKYTLDNKLVSEAIKDGQPEWVKDFLHHIYEI